MLQGVTALPRNWSNERINNVFNLKMSDISEFTLYVGMYAYTYFNIFH